MELKPIVKILVLLSEHWNGPTLVDFAKNDEFQKSVERDLRDFHHCMPDKVELIRQLIAMDVSHNPRAYEN
jgi:hypothetical protein